MNDVINDRYKKGLQIKYEAVTKMGKSVSGITQNGWVSFMQQSGIANMIINVKDLTIIFNS